MRPKSSGMPNPSRMRMTLHGETRRAFGKRDGVGWTTGVEGVEETVQIADVLSHLKEIEMGMLKFPELSEGQTY